MSVFSVTVYPFHDGESQIYLFHTRDEAQAFADAVNALPEADLGYLGAGSAVYVTELVMLTATEALADLTEHYNLEKE